jgi:RNA polymerase sigma factor (sigma-70 family)
MANDEASQFYYDHRKDLLAFAFVLAKDMPDAEDAVAEAVRKSWEYYHLNGTLCPPGPDPVAWMKVVIRNHLTSEFRRRRSAMRRLPKLMSGPEADPAEEAIRKTLGAQAWQKLKDLSPEQQEIAYLLWREELDTKQIAERLGIRPSSVRAAKRRIVHRLRAAMGMDEDRDSRGSFPGMDDLGTGEGVTP